MENHKSLGLLSIARKGRNVELGEEPVAALAKQGKARLILLASDAGDGIRKKTERLAAGTKMRVLTVPFDKKTLGGAMGWSDCAVCAFSDNSFAVAFVKTLPPTEENAALLEYLEARQARFRKRAGTKKHK